ncbi:ferric iron reductase protein FhuF [Chromohalobacter marismortui]|uniref:Ferric iron reductase protein FhuF n=1 Tax=Chromohalobacter marismortui TaxID=42055 RepID=A0A4R7NSJ0_9GAMM|nr:MULTISPECIES: siderophore-iron reductase FhuF [Chromohalobacter]MCI0592374.1 siderophore-iron reductase FhuF [Chromohalobacter sp.]TDU23551.1 ferric iron reductase protein FhuF [Chromohalobacter marismortui]
MATRCVSASSLDASAEALLALYRQPPLNALRAPGFGLPDVPTCRGVELLEPETLNGLLDRVVADYGVGADRKAAASLWSKYHLSALSIPTLVANLLLNQALPVALDDVRVSVGEKGETARLWLPHGGRPVPSREPGARFGALFEGHCRPLIDCLAELSGLSPKVFWSNLGHYVEYVAQTCSRHPDFNGAGDPLLRFLEMRFLPDGRRNPLYRPVRYLDLGGEAPARVRRLCCVKYRLPGEALCGTCPLKPENRPVKRRS